MNILLLSPYPEKLTSFLESYGENVTAHEDPISAASPDPSTFAFAISHGYRHLVPSEALERWRNRIVNLHTSMLPWNRGADPNFWAAYDGTPVGVSIHHIDAGIDTGDLIAQAEVPFMPSDTLATSYARQQTRVLDLFSQVWPQIKSGTAPRTHQPDGGSEHKGQDKTPLMAQLPLQWDTPISDVVQLAQREAGK